VFDFQLRHVIYLNTSILFWSTKPSSSKMYHRVYRGATGMRKVIHPCYRYVELSSTCFVSVSVTSSFSNKCFHDMENTLLRTLCVIANHCVHLYNVSRTIQRKRLWILCVFVSFISGYLELPCSHYFVTFNCYYKISDKFHIGFDRRYIDNTSPCLRFLIKRKTELSLSGTNKVHNSELIYRFNGISSGLYLYSLTRNSFHLTYLCFPALIRSRPLTPGSDTVAV
jgi:hypothetical protein